MKHLLRNMVIFSLPFFAWLLLLVLCDPFNYFNVSHLIPDDVKASTSSRLNERLWKAIAFKRNPSPCIVLGDSRVAGIDPESIERTTGKDYFNFAYGGASLTEMVNTFHFARKYVRLTDVHIGINLDAYNEYSSSDLFSGVEAVVADPKSYLFNRSVAEALLYNIAALARKQDLQIGKPQADKKGFWEYQLNYGAAIRYQRYRYPTAHYRRLQEIAAYCREHGIQLVFFIPPMHVDLQKKREEFGLADAETRFKRDLEGLGKVYDLDYPNAWTMQRDNFNDPFHCTKEARERIISDIWGSPGNYVRILGPQASAEDQDKHDGSGTKTFRPEQAGHFSP